MCSKTVKAKKQRRRFTRAQIRAYACSKPYRWPHGKPHFVVSDDRYSQEDNAGWWVATRGVNITVHNGNGDTITANTEAPSLPDMSNACGHCPRSMKCLEGTLPLIICRHCRRTNAGHSYAALTPGCPGRTRTYNA